MRQGKKWPAYLGLPRRELAARAEALEELASPCRLCPRECGARRKEGERGACRAGLRPWVASFGPHFGEERVLVGRGGSGTIFLTGCNLHCRFCQNYEISQLGEGREISLEELAGWMLRLQELGCENLNFVTPTHQAPQLIAALALAREAGLRLPVVWNCGGYESVAALRLLVDIVDIYMPDFKYGDSQVAAQLSQAPGYFEVAQAALKEMHRQVGDLEVRDGIARRGLLVRHLVLPEGLAHSKKVFQFLASEISPRTAVNVMAQYYPTYRAWEDPRLARRLTQEEYRRALEEAKECGLVRAGPY
ncbi:MAG TPA: radical SAM protein [Candidatus Acetothermia bacterium]|nr:radical SAM protein [Candidatus Acetothermia bacterium]